nr:MAG TPA: hypothetical protein [Crassvirales sp.]
MVLRVLLLLKKRKNKLLILMTMNKLYHMQV